MLQRVQTIYLALAIIVLVVCCCLRLATFYPQGMALPQVMYSLVLVDGTGAVKSYLPLALFLLTVLAEVALVAALCGYKNRRRQMRFCALAIVIELLWVGAYVVVCCALRAEHSVHVAPAAACPLVAVVLTLLAMRSIRRDEALVRAADRIR